MLSSGELLHFGVSFEILNRYKESDTVTTTIIPHSATGGRVKTSNRHSRNNRV